MTTDTDFARESTTLLPAPMSPERRALAALASLSVYRWEDGVEPYIAEATMVVQALVAERDALRERAGSLEAIASGQAAYCVWCHYVSRDDAETQAHAETCETSPGVRRLRALEAAARAAQAQVAEGAYTQARVTLGAALGETT